MRDYKTHHATGSAQITPHPYIPGSVEVIIWLGPHHAAAHTLTIGQLHTLHRTLNIQHQAYKEQS